MPSSFRSVTIAPSPPASAATGAAALAEPATPSAPWRRRDAHDLRDRGTVRRKALQMGADGAMISLTGAAWHHDGQVVSVLVLTAVALVSFARLRLYATRTLASRVSELRRIVVGLAMATLVASFVSHAVGHPQPTGASVGLVTAASAAVFLERLVARSWFRRLRRDKRLSWPTILVGNGPELRSLVRTVNDEPVRGHLHGHQLVGVVTDDLDTSDLPTPVLGPIDAIENIAQAWAGATVLFCAGAVDFGRANHLARALHSLGLHVEFSLGARDIAPERITIRRLGRHDVMFLEPHAHRGWRACFKRSFDVAVSLGAVAVIAPLLVFVALAVRLTSSGPVLFRQERLGRHGRTFTVLKFRTMVVNAEELILDLRDRNEADGPLFKMRDDPRVTRVGRLLRKTSIDELPQLFNVLRGDMSLIGPRPALPSEAAAWTEDVEDRLSVRPGITGMWQVSGRSNASFDDYVRLDLEYVDNWSLLTDLWILAKTIPCVLRADGAC